ncbi:hypothetical protein SDC9_138158 [bioreactor metagenome]|uniref:Uncharacterized protein n=1 Tax=bioreactor metagenome TaxID=1076179 RepID=A0A645DQP2_9ZZZZ
MFHDFKTIIPRSIKGFLIININSAINPGHISESFDLVKVKISSEKAGKAQVVIFCRYCTFFSILNEIVDIA